MVDKVVIQTPETTGEAPADHNQKMIDKANGITPQESPKGDDFSSDRPEWLPEKFKSVEDMAKAYSELEGKLGSQDKSTEKPAASTEATSADEAEAAKALANTGLSLTEFSQEFDAKGELSEASYAKLAAAGFDKALVDSYVSGQQAKAALHEASLKDSAGGSKAYEEMTNWAKATMTPAEIDAYNLSVSSSNIEAAKLAIAGLRARYESANGREPKLQMGSNAAVGRDVFESRAEMTTAMKDPRYAKDSAYRQKVIDKIGRSSIL